MRLHSAARSTASASIWSAHPYASTAPQTKSYSARLIEQRQAEEQAVARDALHDDIARLRWLVADLKLDLAIRRLQLKYGFNPDQPRRSKGDPEGPGQWTDGGVEAGRVRLAQVGETITDAYGNPYYRPGGHHELAKEIYGKWNLQPETEKVFEKATTGTLPRAFIRTSPDGVPIGNFWDGRNGAHGRYNEAVKELSDHYLEKNNLKPENMTPDQARGLLKEIRESQDPRIRDFNGALRTLRRLFPLRTGRGNE